LGAIVIASAIITTWWTLATRADPNWIEAWRHWNATRLGLPEFEIAMRPLRDLPLPPKSPAFSPESKLKLAAPSGAPVVRKPFVPRPRQGAAPSGDAPAADLFDEGDSAGVGEAVVTNDEADLGVGCGLKGVSGVEVVHLASAVHAFAKVLECLQDKRVVINQEYGRQSGGGHGWCGVNALNQTLRFWARSRERVWTA
jgi:hypothetical protein